MYQLSVVTTVIICFDSIGLSVQDFSAYNGLAEGVTHQNTSF